MATPQERTHKLGTIFKFPGFRGVFVLARMVTPGNPSVGVSFFNLISLLDGNVKTDTWEWLNSRIILIPEYTWNRGGPPEVVFVPTGAYDYGSSNTENFILNLIKHDDLLDKHRGKNLNRELIESIKG